MGEQLSHLCQILSGGRRSTPMHRHPWVGGREVAQHILNIAGASAGWSHEETISDELSLGCRLGSWLVWLVWCQGNILFPLKTPAAKAPPSLGGMEAGLPHWDQAAEGSTFESLPQGRGGVLSQLPVDGRDCPATVSLLGVKC